MIDTSEGGPGKTKRLFKMGKQMMEKGTRRRRHQRHLAQREAKAPQLRGNVNVIITAPIYFVWRITPAIIPHPILVSMDEASLWGRQRAAAHPDADRADLDLGVRAASRRRRESHPDTTLYIYIENL